MLKNGCQFKLFDEYVIILRIKYNSILKHWRHLFQQSYKHFRLFFSKRQHFAINIDSINNQNHNLISSRLIIHVLYFNIDRIMVETTLYIL